VIFVKVGDLLQLNCTSEPSNPAADLKWEINKELVPEQHYIFNEKISHEKKLWISREEFITRCYLVTGTLSLIFYLLTDTNVQELFQLCKDPLPKDLYNFKEPRALLIKIHEEM